MRRAPTDAFPERARSAAGPQGEPMMGGGCGPASTRNRSCRGPCGGQELGALLISRPTRIRALLSPWACGAG
eukprot:4811541-Alexandrium_andersonii.AAC.1